MEVRFLSYKNSIISYYCFGNGPETALFFHGYGEDAASFSVLEKFIGHKYTIYAIDLPYHGKTEWKEGLNFSIADLQSIINDLIKQKKQLTIIGYSLGGRVALSFFQQQPDSVNKMVLLAPDGLKMNFWYWLSTQTWIGNKLFCFTMKHPGLFLAFIRLLKKINLVNAGIFKFVDNYIENKEVREQLFNRWTVLRKLRPKSHQIKSLIRKYKIPVEIIYGKHDRIILPTRGEKFRKGLEEYCSIKIINSGHQIIQEKFVNEILPALL